MNNRKTLARLEAASKNEQKKQKEDGLLENKMIRKAFLMRVNPDQHAEYERRHSPIWPELQKVLKDHGVHHYSIFLDQETSQLFVYVEIEDEARWNAVAGTPICKKWWAYMKDIMPSNPDNSPKSKELKDVFYIE